MTTQETTLARPVTDHELAALFSVSIQTLRRWIASGKIPQPAVHTGKRYWSAETVAKILAGE